MGNQIPKNLKRRPNKSLRKSTCQRRIQWKRDNQVSDKKSTPSNEGASAKNKTKDHIHGCTRTKTTEKKKKTQHTNQPESSSSTTTENKTLCTPTKRKKKIPMPNNWKQWSQANLWIGMERSKITPKKLPSSIIMQLLKHPPNIKPCAQSVDLVFISIDCSSVFNKA